MVDMVKWKNRSPEEQRKILDEQQRMTEEAKRKKLVGSPLILKDIEALAVYKNHEIPLPCLDCGWNGSDQYRVYRGSDPMLGGKMEYVEGTCRKCKKVLKRAFPNPMSSEGMVFVMVAGNLKRDGRLKDER